MARVIFDSTILTDYLAGRPQARREIAGADDLVISMISWMEVMAAADAETETAVRRFLDTFSQIVVDRIVSDRALALRRHYAIKLPSAIVWATAQIGGRILVTRNSADFPASLPGIRIPYSL